MAVMHTGRNGRVSKNPGAKKQTPHPVEPDGASSQASDRVVAYSANGSVVCPSARMPKVFSVIATRA